MNDMRELLDETVERAARFLESLPERRVAAARDAEELVPALDGGLPRKGLPASEILERLDAPQSGDRERLLDVGMTMTEASLCGLGHTAGIAVMSAIEKFPALFQVNGVHHD